MTSPAPIFDDPPSKDALLRQEVEEYVETARRHLLSLENLVNQPQADLQHFYIELTRLLSLCVKDSTDARNQVLIVASNLAPRASMDGLARAAGLDRKTVRKIVGQDAHGVRSTSNTPPF